jgi:hypothetical protein
MQPFMLRAGTMFDENDPRSEDLPLDLLLSAEAVKKLLCTPRAFSGSRAERLMVWMNRTEFFHDSGARGVKHFVLLAKGTQRLLP